MPSRLCSRAIHNMPYWPRLLHSAIPQHLQKEVADCRCSTHLYICQGNTIQPCSGFDLLLPWCSLFLHLLPPHFMLCKSFHTQALSPRSQSIIRFGFPYTTILAIKGRPPLPQTKMYCRNKGPPPPHPPPPRGEYILKQSPQKHLMLKDPGWIAYLAYEWLHGHPGCQDRPVPMRGQPGGQVNQPHRGIGYISKQ